MTTQHTQGPWLKTLSADGRVAVNNHNRFCSEFPIALVNGPSHEVDANARLIAAAPELLAALEYIVNWSPDAGKWNAETARDQALAAIAKAKGV